MRGLRLGPDLLVGNPDPHAKGGFNGWAQVIGPDPRQEALRPEPVDFADIPRFAMLSPIQHVQEHDFAVERPGEVIRHREDFQRALRQIDRQ